MGVAPPAADAIETAAGEELSDTPRLVVVAVGRVSHWGLREVARIASSVRMRKNVRTTAIQANACVERRSRHSVVWSQKAVDGHWRVIVIAPPVEWSASYPLTGERSTCRGGATRG